MAPGYRIATLAVTLLLSIFQSDVLGQNQAQKYEGPKYVLLDELMNEYPVQRYTLNTMELYGVDETIELYNIDSRYGLVLMSVLPHFYSDSNWKPIDLETIKNNILSIDQFSWMIGEAMISKDLTRKKTMEIQLIKSENGSYWASNVCLTEYFYLVNLPSDFNTPIGLLNIGQKPVTMKFMKDSIYPNVAVWKREPFPVFSGSYYMITNFLFIERAYLSHSFEKNGNRYHQFWTFADWRVIDGYNWHRGIDRFVYSPQKGIVAGSFDFYFVQNLYSFEFPPPNRKRNNKSIEELQHNILEEKVMWAAELKDETK